MAEASTLSSDSFANDEWDDVPVCAQPCLLDRETGYWRRCNRNSGSCCPDAKPDGILHLYIWDCVWERCEKEAERAQETAEIFMRGCAARGHPLFANFTQALTSSVQADHFPVQYRYKDFATPAPVTPISGLYGGGALLAWAVAMIAATFSGIRPSSSKRRHRPLDRSRGCRNFQWLRRLVWHLRRDADLIVALALPCVAAGDIKRRWERVDFSQIFIYVDPSLVPASDGVASVTDVLTIRAAIVVISHFVLSILPMMLAPAIADGWAPDRSGMMRRWIRTLSILATTMWCLAITKPLFCQASPGRFNWRGGCYLTNIILGELAFMSTAIPGVGCGNTEAPTLWMGIIGVFSFIGSLAVSATLSQTPAKPLLLPALLLPSIIIFPFLYSMGVIVGYFIPHSVFTFVMPFWYLTTEGRQCSFRPSNIAFSELDQVFALAIGVCSGMASIWDSISEFVSAVRNGDDTAPPDDSEPLVDIEAGESR